MSTDLWVHYTTVHHADLWGQREIYEKGMPKLVSGKYHWLAENEVATTEWTTVAPEKPFYLFRPQNIDLKEEYEKGWKVTEVLLKNTVGVVTGQDSKTIASTLSETNKLAGMNELPLDVVIPILYRPFDVQFITYEKQVVTRPRLEVMRHRLAGKNQALLFMRQVALHENYSHFGVTRNIVDNRAFLSNKGIMALSPLYLYPAKGELPSSEEEHSNAPGGRWNNLKPEFTKEFANKLNMQFIPDGKGDLRQTFGPEDIFHYMYAVFHSPMYRERYAEFLKIDFPRLPLTSHPDLFRELCRVGERLVGLHLVEIFGTTMPKYPVPGNNMIEKVEYGVPEAAPEQGRVYINKTQYFEGVPLEVWNFHIGGYQVCHKWLKDRKGRTLTHDDIKHYQRVVAALAETIRLMEEIDETIEECGGWPIG